MGTYSVLIIFIITRIFDIVVSYLSSQFVTYLGFFPYKEIFHKTSLPWYIYSFANFDGVHYIRTALYGYSQYAQAFFPLYPVLIRSLSPIFGNDPILTGLLISQISLFIGMWIFDKYLKLLGCDKKQRVWTILFLSIFPASFFFGAVYNMSLFFCFIVCSLYFFEKKNYAYCAIFSLFAATTRIEGIFLILPFATPLVMKKFRHIRLQEIIVLLSPVLGLITFMTYLWKTTGDPLFFLHSQAVFGANRSSKIILLPQVMYRYIKIFITATHDFRYWVSVFEFSIFMIVFVALILDFISVIKRKHSKYFTAELGLNIFSILVLILPTLTGTFSSLPRYATMSLSFFIIISKIKNTFVKILIAIIFLATHTMMLAYFIQGYFVS